MNVPSVISRAGRGFANALTLPTQTRDSETLAAQAQAAPRGMGGFAEQVIGAQNEGLQLTTDFLNAYADRAWVYACNRRISKAMKLAPLTIAPDKPDAEPLDQHPLLDLFKRPNPLVTGGLYKEQMETDLGVTGNFYAELVYGGTADSYPLQMYRMRPDKVGIIVDAETGDVAGYLFKPGGSAKPVVLQTWQVWHRRLANALDDYRGMSPLSPARDSISFEYQAKAQTIAYFANGMRFSGMVSGPENVDPTDMSLVRRTLQGRHQGAANANKVLVLPGQWNYTDMSGTPKDSDWLEGLAVSRREVCAVYGIAPPLVGDFSEGTTYSNMAEAVDDFWQTTMVEHFANLDEDINHALLPLFGAAAVNLAAKHDLKDTPAMRDDRDAAFTRTIAAYNGGIITLNESRKEIGEDPFQNGDKRRQLITIDEIPADEPIPDEPEVEPAAQIVPALPAAPAGDDANPDDAPTDDPADDPATTPAPAKPAAKKAATDLELIERSASASVSTHADYPAARRARTGPIVKKSTAAIVKTMAKQRDDLIRWVETAGTRATPPAPPATGGPDDEPPPPKTTNPADIAGLVRSFAWLPAEQAFQKTVRSTHLLAAQQAWDHTESLGFGVTFSLDDPTVVQRLASLRDRPNGISSIVGDQRTNVLDQVAQGMKAGASVQQIINGGDVKQADGSVVPLDGIRGAYKPWSQPDQAWKAQRVARTETGMAYNLSSVDAYRTAGITQVNIFDGDSDEECAAANGATWTLSEFEANPLQHANCVRAGAPAVD